MKVDHVHQEKKIASMCLKKIITLAAFVRSLFFVVAFQQSIVIVSVWIFDPSVDHAPTIVVVIVCLVWRPSEHNAALIENHLVTMIGYTLYVKTWMINLQQLLI